MTRLTERYPPRNVVILAASGALLAALYFPLANFWVTHTSQSLVYVDQLWYASQILGRIWWT